jgi:hypothetical protein
MLAAAGPIRWFITASGSAVSQFQPMQGISPSDHVRFAP